MRELEVVGVRVEMPSKTPIVLLRERDGERYLPVWIGSAEASAIALAQQGVVPPRPLTHDLLGSVITALGHTLEQVRIVEMRDNVYYAELALSGGISISSRTSDAIALALRVGCPIMGAEDVLAAGSVPVPDEDEDEVERFREFLDQVSAEDFDAGRGARRTRPAGSGRHRSRGQTLYLRSRVGHDGRHAAWRLPVSLTGPPPTRTVTGERPPCSSSAVTRWGARSPGTTDRRYARERPQDATDAKRPVPANAQGLLFTEDLPVLDEDMGYRGPTACKAAGITYRQLDYWARTGLVEPGVRTASGSGSQRLYSFRDILVLKVVKRLLDTGVSLQQIRTAVTALRERGVEDLAQITLMSDGASVYECTSADEVIDLVQGGQGVFGIAVGRVWREVEGTLAALPSERADGTESSADDELAKRRAARATG